MLIGARSPSIEQLYQMTLAKYRASGKIIVQQNSHDQWIFQQRMISLYPGDNSKLLLFQDSALTTPVTATGQNVGARLDLETAGSWNGTDPIASIPGCHMIQATAGKLPVLTADGALDYDGSNDFMVSSANLDLSSTDELTFLVGVHKDIDATGVILEHGQSTTQQFLLHGQTGGYAWYSRGTFTASTIVGSGNAAPDTAVLLTRSKIATDTCQIRIDNVLRGSAIADQGTGNYTSRLLYEGARLGTGLFFNGQVYGFTFIGGLLSDAENQILSHRLNYQVGAY